MKIAITIGKLKMEATLNDSDTAKKIADALPITADFSTWGDEIYFAIPVDAPLDATAKEEVEMGDLGYWPTGRAFCIFFGPTPMSRDGKIVPASAVNIVGSIAGDPAQFKTVMDESQVTISLDG